ncbi:hypothetical protein RND81_09G094700 [Saponaria officinalis]|uniref:RING-type E3 ubiquitin transferase n=1 Tax=Saponaria officinalis TaxID=3572 RepID=A0AAW1IJL1_SAPOF
MRRVNEFSPSSSWTTTYRHDNNSSVSNEDSQFIRNHAAAFHNARGGAVATDYRPFEERVLLRPPTVTHRIPMDHYPRPTRIIIVNNTTTLDHTTNPRLPSFLHQFTHRPISRNNIHVPPTDGDASKLTKDEQETVLKNLHRHTYTHVPMTSRSISFYYRGLNKDAIKKASEKNEDEDGKNCAVCLEDFRNGEEVMLTTCKHMFHEECIVPWVKSHGKCPVCRSGLCDRGNGSAAGLNRDRGAVLSDEHRGMFSDDILSLIRAVDEAFILGA